MDSRFLEQNGGGIKQFTVLVSFYEGRLDITNLRGFQLSSSLIRSLISPWKLGFRHFRQGIRANIEKNIRFLSSICTFQNIDKIYLKLAINICYVSSLLCVANKSDKIGQNQGKNNRWNLEHNFYPETGIKIDCIK